MSCATLLQSKHIMIFIVIFFGLLTLYQKNFPVWPTYGSFKMYDKFTTQLFHSFEGKVISLEE